MEQREAVDLAIRPYEAADETAVLQLLQATLAGGPTGQREAAFLRWKHDENPFGKSVALVAEANDRVVGFRTFMRWRFRSDAGTVRAVRAVDTATHPEYQGRGIFTKLTRAALDVVRSDSDLVFNTPNSNSLPGYVKMGWSIVGDVPIAVRPLRRLRFLKGLSSAVSAAPAHDRMPPPCALPTSTDALPPDSELDELLAAGPAPGPKLATDRSARYLQWRYAQGPGLDYRIVELRENGSLTGLAIGRPRWRGQLAEFTLSEVLVRNGDGRGARRLLSAVARSAGTDHVATHLFKGSTAARVAPLAGYVAPPRFGMTLTSNALRDMPVDPAVLSSWALSLGDLEVF